MNVIDSPLAGLTGLAPLCDPSVLIIEPHPTFAESLPRELRETMPDIVFDVCTSREDGVSALSHRRYHAVISDARLARAGRCSILTQALSFACPLPVLISAKDGDSTAVGQALNEGALDVIPCPPRGWQASQAIRPALWLYRLRLTMHHRRQRLQALFERRVGRSAAGTSNAASALLDQTIRDLQETNVVFDRTIQQLESSLHVLENSSRRIESQSRECAIRMVRSLALPRTA